MNLKFVTRDGIPIIFKLFNLMILAKGEEKVFKKGDIIQGTRKNSYGVTNRNALMLVTEAGEHDMKVLVLCYAGYAELGNTFGVTNDETAFKYSSLDYFEEQFPECNKLENLEKYLETANKNPVKKEEGYVLSEEVRNELVSEIRKLLDQYGYPTTDTGVNSILDEWCANKEDLIRLFEKHPNYNGKFQIAFDQDWSRDIDIEAIENFRSWLNLSDVIHVCLADCEKVIPGYPYSETVKEKNCLRDELNLFKKYPKIKTIDLLEQETVLAEYRKLDEICITYEYSGSVFNGRVYSKGRYNSFLQQWMVLDEILANLSDQYVTDILKSHFDINFPEQKIRKGQRSSRAINKILCSLGFNKHPDYNKEFAKFADAINPLKIKRHTILSVHPVDYLTMSFGNSWSSCHTIDKKNQRGIDGGHTWSGCNSSGTESYMLDETSCVFYTVSAEYDGNNLELADKINRCMFHFHDNRLVQGRVYPQCNDNGGSELYKDIREIVQKLFADMLDVPNYWTNKAGKSACSAVISTSGTHYPDYQNKDGCNVSTLKDGRETHKIIGVGSLPICPNCGETHDNRDSILCGYCA